MRIKRPNPASTNWWNVNHSRPSMRKSRAVKQMVEDIVSTVGQTTTHSATASTLPLVIEGLERARVPYMIYAIPGQGYVVKRVAVLPELPPEVKA